MMEKTDSAADPKRTSESTSDPAHVPSRSIASGLLAAIAAAAFLASVEIALTFLVAGDFFISSQEPKLFVASSFGLWLGAISVAALLGIGIGTLKSPLRDMLLCASASLFSATFVYLNTSGRRVASYQLALTLLAGMSAFFIVRLMLKRGLWARLSAWFFLAVAALFVIADHFVLPRLYPAFHLGLSMLSVFAAGAFAARLDLAKSALAQRSRRFVGVVVALTLALLLALLIPAHAMSRMTNARFVAENYAGLTGRLIALFPDLDAEPSLSEAADAVPVIAEDAVSNVRGPNLRDQSVLLITVDALRYDRIERMPFLHEFAQQSANFTRAYTPTPHTSYALASLLTGKPMKPILQVSGSSEAPHVTLPGVLREYGYRTASFYPPAIFFVDASRFAALADRGFDFEYQKTMFASAAQRVEQLDEYLATQHEARPLFVWVHLFEPHEPYDPPARFVTDESDAESRYDGEVLASDEAMGDLVQRFREARPDSTVIISADHGEEFGDHGGYFHGTTLYDEQVRVPFIWSTPDLEAQEIDAPVELIDIVPTLLSGMGIPRDARMRGDDLGALLVGAETQTRAFSEVDDERMIVAELEEATFKLICEHRGPCRLYNLDDDPRERRNLVDTERQLVSRLHSSLAAFVASIPEREAAALSDDLGWPRALAAAELGVGDADSLMSLLGSEREDVRAQAALFLGALGAQRAKPALERLVDEDESASVVREAALALWLLGDGGQRERVTQAAALDDSFARRAALELGNAAGELGTAALLPEPLMAIVRDDAEEQDRRQEAARLLRGIASHANADTLARSASVLIEALSEVNLRAVAAESLGYFEGPEAARIRRALFEHLDRERYLAARGSEAEALLRLGVTGRERTRLIALARRWLGLAEPMPGGVAVLAALGQAESTPANVRIDFDPSDVPRRLVIDVRGVQHSMEVDAGAREFDLSSLGLGSVNAEFVLVPITEPLPPPAPEPFEEGANTELLETD